MSDREERIETYYHEGTRDLAEWLVDAEDEIEMWKSRVARVEELADEFEENGGPHKPLRWALRGD